MLASFFGNAAIPLAGNIKPFALQIVRDLVRWLSGWVVNNKRTKHDSSAVRCRRAAKGDADDRLARRLAAHPGECEAGTA
jgi:hypothetical protein